MSLIDVELLTLFETLVTFNIFILHMNLCQANLPGKHHKTNHWFSGVFRGNRNPADICLLKVNNKNTRTSCEICSKVTIKTPERLQWRRSGVFFVNFEHISQLVLEFLLLTLSM